MKTTFNIELDLWKIWNEESNIADDIKYEIKKEIRKEISKEINQKINKELLTPLISEAKEEMIKQMSLKMSRLKNEIKLPKDSRGNGKLVWLWEFMNSNLTHGNWTTAFRKFLEDQTLKLWKELKERYDSHFANLIVQRLWDNNLLKEGALDILLNTTKTSK